ncbi:PhnA-like protein [Neorhizobium sp. JUb45]|uniref:PhnA-like protein n=1 Tax=unclassified Neorhizobium TaxID=2629175 RepID=UPI00104EF126|nr:PhnA-like protein [Neorhizobium sp. JUb45]TCQ95822.1 hypothetical protein EDF70_12028 [Neorhizobium sp. JUb45]
MTEPHLSTFGVAHERRVLIDAELHKVSWGAIFAGVVIATVVQLLLNLLGVGIGAAVIDPATGDNPTATAFSIGTAGWFIVSGVLAAFVGGFVGSRLSGKVSRSTGSLHGLTTWAVTTLLVVYLLTTSVGALVGGAFSGLSGILSGTGSTVATAAATAAPSLSTATDPIGTIEQNIRQASGGNDPAALRDTAITAVRAALTGDQAQAEEARNRAADALARAQNIPVDEARQQVARYEEQYKTTAAEAKRQATEAAQAATKTISVGAITAAVALLLGAIAAWIGGAAGITKHVHREDA